MNTCLFLELHSAPALSFTHISFATILTTLEIENLLLLRHTATIIVHAVVVTQW